MRETCILNGAVRWRAVMMAVVVVVAGCVSPGGAERAGAPELQLLSAAALELPADCAGEQRAVVRVHFVVGPDGSVSDVRVPGAEPCLSEALARWVTSFRYRAPGSKAETALDWMPVAGARMAAASA